MVRVPESAALPRRVRALIGATDCRWYPVGNGAHLVKWPHPGGALPAGVSIERGGWDHEHCSCCERRIEAGRTFWQTRRGSCFWLCPSCYRRVRRLAREGAAPAPPLVPYRRSRT